MSNDTIERSPGADDDEHLTMGIDAWERNWMIISVALLVVFAAAITIAGFTAGFQLPGAEREVDPRTVTAEGPWANPGVTEIGDGQFEAYVLAQAWSFSPREIVLPVGAKVDIYVTSADLQHGFKITDTNINMQVVPGQVSKLSFTFDEVGEFPYICTEYCGQGHATMFGTVKVLSDIDYQATVAEATPSSVDTNATSAANTDNAAEAEE